MSRVDVQMKELFKKTVLKNNPNRKGGFTLVEVIVTLVITIIVVAVSGSLIITGTNIYSRSAQRDIQTNIAETVLNFTADQLLYAYDIQQKTMLTTDGQTPAYNSFDGAIIQVIHPDSNSASGGYLHFLRDGDSQNPVNIFGVNFYNNYIIDLNLDIQGRASGNNAYFTLTVNVYNKSGLSNNPLVTRTTTKPLLNYNKASQQGLNAQGTATEVQFLLISPKPTTGG